MGALGGHIQRELVARSDNRRHIPQRRPRKAKSLLTDFLPEPLTIIHVATCMYRVGGFLLIGHIAILRAAPAFLGAIS
jgi:hypothetical protein